MSLETIATFYILSGALVTVWVMVIDGAEIGRQCLDKTRRFMGLHCPTMNSSGNLAAAVFIVLITIVYLVLALIWPYVVVMSAIDYIGSHE